MFNTDIEKGLTAEQAEKNQEKSGKNKFGKFREIPDYTMCKRDGKIQQLLSKNLTIGDIVTLKAPQIIPADIRITEVSPDCKVNNADVTGESEPKTKSTESTTGNPIEAENLVLATAKMVQGNCTGIVVRVGKGTIIGQCPEPTVLEF